MGESQIIHLKFGKEANDLELAILGNTLTQMATILKKIGSIHDDNVELIIRAKAFEKGSFDVPIEIVAASLALINMDSIEFVKTTIQCFVEYYKLMKVLKGQEPSSVTKSGNQATVIAKDNEQVIVNFGSLQVYNNHPELHKVASSQMCSLVQDEEIDKFSVTDESHNELLSIERDDFKHFTDYLEIQNYPPYSEDETANLIITKPVFVDKPSSWTVFYKGDRMSVRMEDRNFIQSVTEGKEFAMGDRLNVEMISYYEYDEVIKSYKVAKRAITKVLKHIKKPDQKVLGFS